MDSNSLHLNYVPADSRFTKAAVDFVAFERGCGPAQLHGDPTDAVTFLENFTEGDLKDWPEFLDYCEARGLPVTRTVLAT